MEASCQIENCLTNFGPGELYDFPTPCPIIIDTHQVPRVPPLRRDGDHTRYRPGGMRPGRGSNDLRPLSLETGQTDILDILNEGPPPRPETPPTIPNTPRSKSKSNSPQKEVFATKNRLGSLRDIFSSKKTSTRSNAAALEQAFSPPAYPSSAQQEAATTTNGSEASPGPTTTDQWQHDLTAHERLPDVFEAHRMSVLQTSGDPRYQTLPLHGCKAGELVDTGPRKKYRIITPLKLSRTFGAENTSPLRSPNERPSPGSPTTKSASGKIYGQPPPAMVSPVIPHKVTKEHLSLSSFPSLPRDVIAQLPKDLEPTMPISDEYGLPSHYSEIVSPRSPLGHDDSRNDQLNTDKSKTVSRSVSIDHFRSNHDNAQPQSPPLPELRHEQSMASIKDEPMTPEDYLGFPSPELKFKKNGRLKKYKDNDPMMVNMGFLALEEIYGRQAAIDRFAGPAIVKAATWETQRAREKEENDLIGLGISSRTSAQSFEAGETSRDRGYSNESYGSTVHSPITPRSGYVTPQTPKERQEFYENLHKLVDDESCSKKLHGDFGLSSTPVYVDDVSAAQSPFNDPTSSDQSTTTPYTLRAPGRPFSGEARKYSRPNSRDTQPREKTPAFAKIQGYFHGCTPDSVRNTRLFMSTKEMRAQILARLREITGTERVYQSSNTDHAKSSNCGRRLAGRNLRCTEHMGHCGVCNATCCVYYEAIEASKDAATAHDQEFVNEVGRSIAEASLYPDDLTTFLRCDECSRMICPHCVGICPVDLCQLVSCKVG
ncbi:MAG: hypothetical protein LQ337_004602 [Flavoplaca oasis]|nr:MAG: hypothetical protein LQ337_004602 [Flavoplaca oasis]